MPAQSTSVRSEVPRISCIICRYSSTIAHRQGQSMAWRYNSLLFVRYTKIEEKAAAHKPSGKCWCSHSGASFHKGGHGIQGSGRKAAYRPAPIIRHIVLSRSQCCLAFLIYKILQISIGLGELSTLCNGCPGQLTIRVSFYKAGQHML